MESSATAEQQFIRCSATFRKGVSAELNSEEEVVVDFSGFSENTSPRSLMYGLLPNLANCLGG